MIALITLTFTQWILIGLFNAAIAYWMGYRHGQRKRRS